MDKKTFSIKESFRSSWTLLMSDFWKFAGLTALLTLIGLIIGFIGQQGVVLGGLSALLRLYLMLLGLLIFIRATQEKKFVFLKIFKEINLKTYFHLFFVSVLVGLSMLLGFVLLIIPGIILSLGLAFSSYFVVEGESPVASMKISWHATKGIKWKLLWLVIILGFVNIGGLLVFGVGLILTAPFTKLVMSDVYVNFVKKRNVKEVETSS
jgi:hypothetical protein